MMDNTKSNSQNYTPYKYVGSAFLESADLQMIDEKTFVSLTAKNTGNIPLSKLKMTVGDFETSLSLNQFVQPKENLVLNMRPIDKTFDSETSYPVKYTFIFADESIITAQSTIQILQFIPTPTPSPKPTITPTQTPIPTPVPTPSPKPLTFTLT